MRSIRVLSLALGVGVASVAQAQGGRGRAVQVMTLTSPEFQIGASMPVRSAQPGRDKSPALEWSGVPDSVQSFVLIVHDPSAPIGNGLDDMLHWAVWNIPGSAHGLPGAIPQGGERPDGMRQISASGPYYRGPAAPGPGSPCRR